jgi:hypothetical protein
MKFHVLSIGIILSAVGSVSGATHKNFCDTIPAKAFIKKPPGQTDFSQYADGSKDAYPVIQEACDYCIANPQACVAVHLPVGRFRISHPIILEKVVDGKWQFFTLKLNGAAPAKSAGDQYLSRIICDYPDGFAIGIQSGRGVEIENLAITGKYSFPNSVNTSNIGTLKWTDWGQDRHYSPVAGIVIDPFCDSNYIAPADRYPGMNSFYLPGTGRGGSSGIDIKQCAIHNFPVGIMLTPNPFTFNDEMINITDDNIDAVKVAIAIGQDQSKEIHIDRLKCWASTQTVLDGSHYGRGTGGGSVMINGMNLAGCVNQLFYLTDIRFPLSAIDVYAESLFRIGTVYGTPGANLINCSIDFLTGANMPEPDYLLNCNSAIHFYGGSLRYYDNDRYHRLNLGAVNASFQDMTLNNRPITDGLYGIPTNRYPAPSFSGISGFYSFTGDTLIRLAVRPNMVVDRKNWTARFDAGREIGSYQVGDYILGSGVSTTKFWDSALNDRHCPLVQIGRIVAINGTTVHLINIGLNAYSGINDDAVYISRLK